jgi:hypothetical protein
MHDSHGISFRKAHPDLMGKGVIVRVKRRFWSGAHGEDGI